MLGVQAAEILKRLQSPEAVQEELHGHQLPPFAPKAQWENLGSALKRAEACAVAEVPWNKWLSLRLDGTGFSSMLRTYKTLGVLESTGYSPSLAQAMQQCCLSLMDKFQAVVGFTQSDEITLLIPPVAVTQKGEQQPHMYSGRVMKLCSLAAAHCSVVFLRAMVQLAQQRGIDKQVNLWQSLPLPTFDCRVGIFDTQQEACALLWWRAYDCGINGVADAVYKLKGVPGAKAAMALNTIDKLKFLATHAPEALPLPDHQARGSLYCRVKRRRTVRYTPKSGIETETECLRSTVELVPGHVLHLAAAHPQGHLELTNDD